jgi:hypothetical protein
MKDFVFERVKMVRWGRGWGVVCMLENGVEHSYFSGSREQAIKDVRDLVSTPIPSALRHAEKKNYGVENDQYLQPYDYSKIGRRAADRGRCRP